MRAPRDPQFVEDARRRAAMMMMIAVGGGGRGRGGVEAERSIKVDSFFGWYI